MKSYLIIILIALVIVVGLLFLIPKENKEKEHPLICAFEKGEEFSYGVDHIDFSFPVVEKNIKNKENGIFLEQIQHEREKGNLINEEIRKKINSPEIISGRWDKIIIHSSWTLKGSINTLRFHHQKVMDMKEGNPYHFVIGNRTMSLDGNVSIGKRWKTQYSHGEITNNPKFSRAIGICLIGKINKKGLLSKLQATALIELVEILHKKVGKIPVYTHDELEKNISCPGPYFPRGLFQNHSILPEESDLK